MNWNYPASLQIVFNDELFESAFLARVNSQLTEFALLKNYNLLLRIDSSKTNFNIGYFSNKDDVGKKIDMPYYDLGIDIAIDKIALIDSQLHFHFVITITVTDFYGKYLVNRTFSNQLNTNEVSYQGEKYLYDKAVEIIVDLMNANLDRKNYDS